MVLCISQSVEENIRCRPGWGGENGERNLVWDIWDILNLFHLSIPDSIDIVKS